MVDMDKYVIEIPTQDPLIFNFAWNFKIQLVCLFPGDTLEFRVTSNDSIPFQFGGSRPYRELMFYSTLETSKLGVLVGNNDLEITNRLNFQYVADQTLERYKARLKSLEDQSDGSKFSLQGRNVINQSLYFQYLVEMLFPYNTWKPIGEIKEKSGLVPDFYKAKLRDLENEFNRDSLMYLFDYKRFVRAYARFLMIETAGEEKIDLDSRINFYMKTFHGQKRDMLLFDEIVLDYRVTGDLSHIVDVIDSIENKQLRDILMSIQSEAKKEFSGQALQAALEATTGKKMTLQEMMSMYPNKLIYLDFWATWCKPCLMEMPDSEKLTQEFKNDSIEFVYLSIDTDKQKWLKKTATLPSGNNAHHYRISDGPGFVKEMEMQGVPQYILIGKNGQIISSNAPRPRSTEIRKLISENMTRKND